MNLTMNYNVDFEACALLFLLLVAFRYFEIKYFPNLKNKMFGFVIIAGIVDLALDIIGAIMVDNMSLFPLWLTYIVNMAFYCLQLCFPFLSLLYMKTVTNPAGYSKKTVFFISIPMIIFIIILFINIWNGIIFSIQSIDGKLAYIHGWLFPLMYVEAGYYLAATLITVCINKRQMTEKEFNSTIAYIIIIVASLAVQIYNPEILLTGVSIAVAITLVFYTMQNPDEMIDVTTGVFNYTALLLFLRDNIGSKRSFHVIAVDIAGMRRINGIFGLEAGNRLMWDIGQFLHQLSSESFVFRMTGTRFSIATYSDSQFKHLLDAIEDRFKQPWIANGIEMPMTAAIRYFPDSNEFESPQNLIDLIDMSYSDVINCDANSKIEITEELFALIQHRLAVETALRNGVETGEGFELNFQPVFSLKDKKFSAAEVLLRFTDESFGPISPAEFIPIAEKTGLIFKIDDMVVRKVCEFIVRTDFFQKYDTDSLEINLSGAEFARDNLSARILSLASEFKIDPSKIVFEVTETAASKSNDVLKIYMKDLIASGFRFALDDYGTGYANIVQVAKLPFSIVKIDRTVLVDDETNQDTSVVFEYTMKMMRALGLKTVVEGVETEAQLIRAEQLGADFIQGYYFAKPMSETDYIEFLTRKA